MTEEEKQEVIGLCRRLIQTRSYSGEEQGVVKLLSEYMKENGFDEVYTDRYGNVIGRIFGNRPGPTLLFDGHIDTVPVNSPERWTHDPFGAEIVDGKIYGRGTSDMKGAVAAYTAAAAAFLKKHGHDFAGTICVDGVVHEECFEGVASRAISEREKPDVVIIGEASECKIKSGQRGRAEIVLETFGKSVHSSNPEKGVNAVYAMLEMTDAVRKLPVVETPELGRGILELTDIKSSPYPGASVVPDYCRVTYDRRLLQNETKESILAPIEELAEKYMAAHPEGEVRVSLARGQETCYTGEQIEDERFFPAWYFAPEEDYLVQTAKALEEAGIKPEFTHYSFCTNGSHYAGEKGIRTFGFGPSKEELAHTVDEYVELEQLLCAAAGYEAIMQGFLG
ncbi:MAG: YgeY family selenium metabolism-linked hydrolase [Lachnospiraceae bacterium]|nr:YgeY family selenium metabolism-linked hydrolase [Lachnospiraceae bacterium]